MQKFSPRDALKRLLPLFIISVFASSVGALPLSDLIRQKQIRRIGLYVGTFDPWHKGHEETVNHVLKSELADAVVVIPQNFQVFGFQPYKPKALPVGARLDMLTFLYRKNPQIFYPENKTGLSADLVKTTVQWLRDNLPEDIQLVGIHGADNYSSFHKRLFDRMTLDTDATIVVEKFREYETYLMPKYFLDRPVQVLYIPQALNVSSTLVRTLLRQNRSADAELRTLIDRSLLRYIHQKGFYQVPPCERALSRG